MHERTAFITGASRGIGRGIAERLAARGVVVVLAAPEAEPLEEVRRGIEARGGRAVVAPLDVTEPARVVEVVKRADDDLGGLDLVVANAGIGGVVDVPAMTWERVAPVLYVNVIGAIATLTAALPAMIARRKGHIVGISSLAGLRGLPRVSHYCASKAALSTFLEGVRVDLEGTGVAVTDVQPGFVASDGRLRREYPTPLMMPLDEAVHATVAAIDERRPVAAFPRSVALLLGASRLVPRRLYDAMLRRATR